MFAASGAIDEAGTVAQVIGQLKAQCVGIHHRRRRFGCRVGTTEFLAPYTDCDG